MATSWLSVIRIGLWLLLHSTLIHSDSSQPNIIFMLADDIGFNDLGYNGCTATETTFIDNLATTESLRIRHNYVYRMCSPSRAAFLSGRYPSKLGLQNLVFNVEYPVSLTRQVSTISDEFSGAGYTTHAIGKWHLGMQSWEYTPTYRGFDSFAGFWGGWSSYYDHTMYIPGLGADDDVISFYDLRENEDEVTDAAGIYGVWWQRDRTLELLQSLKNAEDPFFLYLAWQSSHEPNEAPSEYIEKYENKKVDGKSVSGPVRQFAMAQTHSLDVAVEDVVTCLKKNGMWENTLIVFSSDNGADYNRGDNYPLRGFKNSAWEGGVRVPAFVTGGYLSEHRRGEIMDDAMVHIIDWYPTLLSAAGIKVGHKKSTKFYSKLSSADRFDDQSFTVPLDGKDLWSAIQTGNVEEDISIDSRQLLLELNGKHCEFSSCGALRDGKWKFIRGENICLESQDIFNHGGPQWQSNFAICEGTDNVLQCDDTASDSITQEELDCYKAENGCLFNLEVDPCELNNVGEQYPEVRDVMISTLDGFEENAVTPLLDDDDVLDFDDYDPEVHCDSDFWCPFMDFENVPFEDVLTADYRRLFADSVHLSDSMPSEFDRLDALSAASPDLSGSGNHVFADWNILGIEVDSGRGEWRIAFVLCLLIAMSVICMVHINGLYSESRRRETVRKIKGETAPLI